MMTNETLKREDVFEIREYCIQLLIDWGDVIKKDSLSTFEWNTISFIDLSYLDVFKAIIPHSNNNEIIQNERYMSCFLATAVEHALNNEISISEHFNIIKSIKSYVTNYQTRGKSMVPICEEFKYLTTKKDFPFEVAFEICFSG